MDSKPQAKTAAASLGETAENEALVRAVGTWVQQFARTLKNCRLYDIANPTVIRFRQQLVAALHQVIQEHGSFTLRFGPDDVTCESASLYPARSRDDNLALPFYRDGIRGLTFHDGVEPREIDALIRSLLRVTSVETSEEEDLVTVLWEAQLPHIAVDYIPAEGDVGAGAAEPEGEVAPWPTGQTADLKPEEPAPRTLTDPPPGENRPPRSDDWTVGELTADFETEFAELQVASAKEMERFRKEYDAECATLPISSAIAVARAFLNAEVVETDLPEIRAYLPRVLRMAIQGGAWRDARVAVGLMRDSTGGWSPVGLVQDLQQPNSIAVVRDVLLVQSEADVRAFAEFTDELGEYAVDVLGQVMAELDGAPQSRPLIEAIVEKCRTTPERMAPWVADRRPNVAQAAVHILAAIGGNAIAGPLQAALRHPEARLKADVVQALRSVEAHYAKPLLLPILPELDSRSFSIALQKLGEARDPQVAESMLMFMVAPEFEQRPADEKHAIYMTLGATGGDEVIPELEAELLKGGWFERVNESHRQTVARCLVRIGTPLARMVLENGAKSKRAQVRDVCTDVLAKWQAPRG